MALYYNLAKVYAQSDDDAEFVNKTVNMFVSQVPLDLDKIKKGIEERDYELAYSFAHKIKPTLDLLGMNVTFDEILQIEDWAKTGGKKKEIKENYKSIQKHIEKAIKEIKKDFKLKI